MSNVRKDSLSGAVAQSSTIKLVMAGTQEWLHLGLNGIRKYKTVRYCYKIPRYT